MTEKCSNDYREASLMDDDLWGVKMRDGGWSIANGPGSMMASADDAGWHLPVRFEAEGAALDAILSGPRVPFDFAVDGAWVTHCLSCGGVLYEPYSK
ncbi:hypothetical protein PWP93_36350 [Paraburkholderia sp. A1RI-2L]|uniref:hypothetical protein n=1 Tax=Paraburkholderia sp. A1RI-2L TaxID=3028367 RepID=UPI003B8243A4